MFKISLVAYESRQGKFIFYAVPNQPGRYLRSDKSVLLATCEVCKAAIGEPCHDQAEMKVRKYHTNTHYVRRIEARKISAAEVRNRLYIDEDNSEEHF